MFGKIIFGSDRNEVIRIHNFYYFNFKNKGCLPGQPLSKKFDF